MCAGPVGIKDPGSVTSELLSSSAGSPRSLEPLRHPRVLTHPVPLKHPAAKQASPAAPKAAGAPRGDAPRGFPSAGSGQDAPGLPGAVPAVSGRH